jgi:hypothetical protein
MMFAEKLDTGYSYTERCSWRRSNFLVICIIILV